MKPVHAVGWAQQGDLQIFCTEEFTEAGWVSSKDLPENIFRADNHELYTFVDNLVTCEHCLAKDKASK